MSYCGKEFCKNKKYESWISGEDGSIMTIDKASATGPAMGSFPENGKQVFMGPIGPL